jgi:hypothetical protein
MGVYGGAASGRLSEYIDDMDMNVRLFQCIFCNNMFIKLQTLDVHYNAMKHYSVGMAMKTYSCSQGRRQEIYTRGAGENFCTLANC